MQRTLDWRSNHDPRSRAYPVRRLAVGRPRSYTWRCPVRWDQGVEGACVGHAWTHELAARPVELPTTQALAFDLYREAQRLDVWPGEAYEGTSVLAGAKAVQVRGGLTSYSWAFSVDDLALGVGLRGPAVLGIPWLDGMFDTDADGQLHADGDAAGGHAILCNGVNLAGRYFTLTNSWGRSWGRDGAARISFDDLARLLADDGEACLPMRSRP